jgi:hypothetical protein
LGSTNVYRHFTHESITKVTDTKEYESIDIHGVRNSAVTLIMIFNKKLSDSSKGNDKVFPKFLNYDCDFLSVYKSDKSRI